MFFLGGFNTALPYLLYLSLIWIFMIIGLSGKHHLISPGKSYTSEQKINVYQSSVASCDRILFDAVPVSETGDSIIQNDVESIYCLYITSLPPDCQSDLNSRGPPVVRG